MGVAVGAGRAAPDAGSGGLVKGRAGGGGRSLALSNGPLAGLITDGGAWPTAELVGVAWAWSSVRGRQWSRTDVSVGSGASPLARGHQQGWWRQCGLALTAGRAAPAAGGWGMAIRSAGGGAGAWPLANEGMSAGLTEPVGSRKPVPAPRPLPQEGPPLQPRQQQPQQPQLCTCVRTCVSFESLPKSPSEHKGQEKRDENSKNTNREREGKKERG